MFIASVNLSVYNVYGLQGNGHRNTVFIFIMASWRSQFIIFILLAATVAMRK